MAASLTGVTVAPTATGCLITLPSRATVRESRAIKDVAQRTLKSDGTSTVVLDLSDCAYVDSTFLGTLIDLHRAAGAATPPRLQIAGSPEQRKKLLGVARLEKLIPGIDAPPTAAGPAVPLPTPEAAPQEIMRHIMECHKKLAEIDCPMRPVFARIAAQMEAELQQPQSGS